jgi:PiT family inorganic phosphate transporter
MDSCDIVIALVVATALGVDFTNGFRDTTNAMATSIATPRVAPEGRGRPRRAARRFWNLITWWRGTGIGAFALCAALVAFGLYVMVTTK